MNQGTGESKFERLPKLGEALVFSEQNHEGREQLITADTPSLDTYFPITSLRIGPKTGVTIFSEENYQGVSQELTSELASFVNSRLQNQNPKSLKIWSAVGRPFTGYWAIEVVEGRYLSVHPDSRLGGLLTTSQTITEREGFRISDLGEAGPGRRDIALSMRNAPFEKPTTSTQPSSMTIADLEKVILVDEPEAGFRKFSLLTDGDQWICYNPDEDNFLKSTDAQARTILCRSIKLAEDETQIGELLQGEAALYENPAYWGRAWIFHADYAYFDRIAGLNDAVSSIQLGPLTGATIYKDAQFKADDPIAGKQDIVSDLASLEQEQVGENQISSIDLWQIVPPAGMAVAVQCRLSQDFRGTGATFEEYSAYRTTLRLSPTVETVDVWTTDETQIMVDNEVYHVDEDHSVTLRPNLIGCLVITTDALASSEGEAPRGSLRAPGFKIRTNTMLPHERIVIFPDQEVHEHLANLKDKELWDATINKKGVSQPLVQDRSPQSQSNAANAQKMIQKIMSTVKYSQGASGGWEQVISPEELKRKFWALDFQPRVAPLAFSVDATDISGVEPLPPAAKFRQMSRTEFQALFNAAESPDLAQWWLFDQISQAVQNAASVVVAEVNKVVTIIVTTVVETGQKILQWVIDTAEKVAAFAEAIFEKIGVAVNDVVDWLRYVFDWDDILQTRDYLRDSFIKSLDYIGQTLVKSAKEPVSRFFKDAKHTVTNGFDAAIEALGGTIDDAAASQNSPSSIMSTIQSSEIYKLLETGEWMLSKIMSSGQENLNFALGGTNVGGSLDPADEVWDEKLRRFSDEILAKGLESVATIPQGVEEIITTLVKNPDRPLMAVAALLKIFRSMAIGLIDIGEDIVLGLLDLVTYLIEKIKGMLTADIRIPFISDLLEWMGKPALTLGFSLLDAVTLILAVPVTAISKVVLHETPFKNASALALSVDGWTITAGVSDLLGGFVSAPLDGVPEDALGPQKNTLEIFSFIFAASSAFANWGPNIWGETDSEQHDTLFWTLFCIEAGFLVADLLSFRMGSISGQMFKLARFKRQAVWTMVTTSLLGLLHCGLLIASGADKTDVIAKVPEILSFMKAWEETAPELAMVTGTLFIIIDIAAGFTSLVANTTG